MSKRMVINDGFVTNSSSCVYQISKEVLEHPDVQAFFDLYGIEDGYVGRNLWSRGDCESIAVSESKQKKVQERLKNGAWGDYEGPHVDVDDDQILVVYGDEYDGVAQELVRLLREVDGAGCSKVTSYN